MKCPTLLNFNGTYVHLRLSVFQNAHFRLSGKVAKSCPLLKMMPNYEETAEGGISGLQKSKDSRAGKRWKTLLRERRKKETDALDTRNSILCREIIFNAYRTLQCRHVVLNISVSLTGPRTT